MKLLSGKLVNFISKTRPYSLKCLNPPWNVLFFGTDTFSLYSLEFLNTARISGNILNKLEVVTTCKGKPNPVKKYAEQNELVIHSWPFSVPKNNYHVGLVVSFGHLIPESIIEKFPLGMLNVHGSLLPRWRGAAPIIHALAHGDCETGVTVMRIKPKHFDIGEIVLQEKISISREIEMPELHQKLGYLGAECLVSTLKNLPEVLEKAIPQPTSGISLAPKINPDFALVDWNAMTSTQVFNLYRSVKSLLSPTTSWAALQIKLIDIIDCGYSDELENCGSLPGHVTYDRNSRNLIVKCAGHTSIKVKKVHVYGRKLMNACDFNNGFLMKESANKRYFKCIDFYKPTIMKITYMFQ